MKNKQEIQFNGSFFFLIQLFSINVQLIQILMYLHCIQYKL